MTDLADYRLTDRYTEDTATVFLSGVQALARLPIEQLRADRAAGLNTAAFVSGYPGSPLGGFDQEMARAARTVPDLPIVCQPGVNEELGATAVMGSQLVATQPDFRYDGVVGVWYGKAPGLDRACDALRHAVFAGTSPHGGAVALVGDDPAAKSSTLPSSSDATLVDLHMPVLYPGDVQEAVDLSRHAVALSRATGIWSAMKIVAAVADGTGTVELSPDRVRPVTPTLEVDGEIWTPTPDGRLLTPYTLELEREFREVRLELARMYAVENRLNHVTVDSPDAWLGIVASGYTYKELLHALARLGLDSERAIADAGIRLFQMQMPVPFDPANLRRFARGLDEIIVVEEKNPTLEVMIKDALYGGPDQPRVVGKHAPDGSSLIPAHGILDATTMLDGLRARLSPRLADRLTPEAATNGHADGAGPQRKLIPVLATPIDPTPTEETTATRSPFFCSGCPHNWSTKVPEDTLVGAGIGCHGMVLLMDPDRVGETIGTAAMGGEGVQWSGMAPFVDRAHIVQNLGDGTFFHSGQLAIQASVAAGTNITYKLLVNGTVAMTGGQDAVGGVGVPEITAILLAHGVAEVLVTTDDPGRYGRGGTELPDGVEVWDRTRIIEAQERLAAVPGTTVLIHDQACAAENRRGRKRGTVETPAGRVVINHRICEGCGDCGDVSNCLSVQPLDTPLGRKTTIDQASCNLDFSCLHGDCPSFMTVEPADDDGPGRFGRRRPGPTTTAAAALPEPHRVVGERNVGLRMVGIGGTGVVTVAQILGTAGLLDGWDVRGLDQTGLSQKAGPVVSDLRLSRGAEPPESNLLGDGEADAILAFDLLGAVTDKNLAVADVDRTVVIGSTTAVPTGSMVSDPSRAYPDLDDLTGRLDARSRAAANRWIDSARLSDALVGNAAAANLMLLGVAYQAGVLPMSADSIARAVDLNGVAVEANQAAFDLGRRWHLDPTAVEADAAAAPSTRQAVAVSVNELPRKLAARVAAVADDSALAELLTMLTADLVDYQDRAYAGAFLDVVERVAATEGGVVAGSTDLTEAVARHLHKLSAYKDEYEVARLLLAPEGQAAAEAVAGPGAKVTWRLHPPMLKALGMDSKLKLNQRWMRPAMHALRRGKKLRGTAADPFGRTELRRLERDLVDEYRGVVDRLIGGLTADNLDDAVGIASLPDLVRGYEDLKLRRIGEYRAELERRLAAWSAS